MSPQAETMGCLLSSVSTPGLCFRTVTGLCCSRATRQTIPVLFLVLETPAPCQECPTLSVIASSGPDRVWDLTSRQGLLGPESDQHPHVAWWMVRAVEEGWSPAWATNARETHRPAHQPGPAPHGPDRIWLLFTELMMLL